MTDVIKNRILANPDELDSALRYSDIDTYHNVMKSIGLLAEYGREIKDPNRDKRIDQQTLDEVADMSSQIDAILDDWINADPDDF